MAGLKVKGQCYPNKLNLKKVGWWVLGRGVGERREWYVFFAGGGASLRVMEKLCEGGADGRWTVSVCLMPLTTLRNGSNG